MKIAKRFLEELIEDGHSKEKAEALSRKLQGLIDRDFPEIAAIDELREQFNAKSWQDRLLPKMSGIPKYSKKLHGDNPVEFMKQHYSALLQEGNITANQIARYDPNLRTTLYKFMKGEAEHGARVSIADLIADESAQPVKASPFKRRLRACATLLGTSESEAARFLTSVRPDRVGGRD